jgi:hypothetical protein
MSRHLRVRSRRFVIPCLALFVALGGTAAAVTVTNANRLGGRPASAYLLKSGQPLRSTGLVHLALNDSKVLFTLADGNIIVEATCIDQSPFGKTADLIATPHEAGVYSVGSNSTPLPVNVSHTLGFTGDYTGSYLSYNSTDLTAPQGDYYLQEAYGVDPGAGYSGYCVFDVRAYS